MKFLLHPWQLFILILTGWIYHREQEVIEYLRAENRVLREKLGKKRILLNDDQRRCLAIKGKILGRKMLEQMATIVTPDTILRWHRELVAAKWDYSGRRKKVGYPPASTEVVELALRMARENPSWGYNRIKGALANLGHLISNTCVAGILKAHGIDPAPDRKRQSTVSPVTWHAGNDWVGCCAITFHNKLPDLPIQMAQATHRGMRPEQEMGALCLAAGKRSPTLSLPTEIAPLCQLQSS